ncbi:T9SS type A sorting domain-containing protein [Flavobacterium sp.]|uniref:T9SS type A sorting domain-containing protein n=1 Tax=Flavobacterium sp. TaxID=239 RepID=UPI00286BF866|nr:T9SS type A sorting domain-containing protein [Flavobacterium sp.]
MKKLLLTILFLQVSNFLSAQEYHVFQSSGFNADVIADGIGGAAATTSIALDAGDFTLMSADFENTLGDPVPAYALPVSGLIDDLSLSGLSFQLAGYYENNSLRLENTADLGSLSFFNPAAATNIYILANSGSGTATLDGIIYFSDGSNQPFSGAVIPDWFFSNALPVVLSGFGRVSRTTDIMENPANDPRFYRYDIAILPENQTKDIVAMDFTKSSTAAGIANIFAVSAKLLGTCPEPTSLVASDITETSATISWTDAVIVPALGYEYFITTSNNIPTPSTPPSGEANGNSAVMTGLTIGTHYCVWVRSHCSATESGEWFSVCFTTGEISTPYTGSDIPTLYTLTPTASSPNTCPGLLTVHVPYGYHINGVSTAYQMQTASNGWMSEQRSLLVCNTTGNAESALTSGIGGSTGTYSYNRSDIHIADGAVGDVEFELRAWRTYGGSDCNADYNRVLASSWTVTFSYAPNLGTQHFNKGSFIIYPNPSQDLITVATDVMIEKVQLFNLLGQEVLQQNNINAKETQCALGSLPTGKYLLKVISENGVETKGIIKN